MSTVYRYRHRVTFDETNLVGNVYFAHYLHWQGHCRELFLADHAPGVIDSLAAGELALVTVSCSMDFYDECRALDDVEVAMALVRADGNRVEMGFDYHRGSTLVAAGRQTVACMTRSTNGLVPTAVPAELDSALRSYR
ncbi:acyl-CoA thioesterase [Pseudonocardia sp. EV170527-09]|uniref:acyl-CoA thioesterase n=1 Tax=Pseudonocardia sp. EV170527-09 TaxID=2603411 RepID=UPI0011F1F81E|nr:acyl-CoA thioesterase [Pseudonocardia sp. EV170527-09]KAA1018360.1 acyl-CoA thioesterase [Pseudonocardia sp. EV170527-09]